MRDILYFIVTTVAIILAFMFLLSFLKKTIKDLFED